MSRLSVGVRLPPCRPVAEVARAASLAERAGFDSVLVPDSQLLWRDPYLTLLACATRTSGIELGTAVTNVVTRHPTVIASLARTLAEAAPGRFHLGLGVGNSALRPIGLRPSTRADLRSAITTIRALLGGEETTVGDRTVRLRDPHGPVPISIAASGPRNLGLAGEVGDAVITLSGIEPGSLRRSRELVAAGALAAGRPADAVRLIASAYCQVTDDLERDARTLKPVCAAIAQKGGRTALLAAGIDVAVPASVPEVYPDLLHAEDWTKAVEVCSAWISDQDAVRFAQTFCLFGTADEVTAGLRAAHAAGADAVFLQHVGSYHLPVDLIAAYGEEIHQRLAAA